jgi:hypothetical protein
MFFIRDSRDGAIANGYGLDGQRIGVQVPLEVKLFSSPLRPDRFWRVPIFLPNGYQGSSYPGSNAAGT